MYTNNTVIILNITIIIVILIFLIYFINLIIECVLVHFYLTIINDSSCSIFIIMDLLQLL